MDKITFTKDELRKIGNLEGLDDRTVEEIADFLAEYSVIIYKALLSERDGGDK